MSIITFEGTVHDGMIKLADNVRLPDNTKVYIVVPDLNEEQAAQQARLYSPRLAHPEQPVDFTMEVIEGP